MDENKGKIRNAESLATGARQENPPQRRRFFTFLLLLVLLAVLLLPLTVLATRILNRPPVARLPFTLAQLNREMVGSAADSETSTAGPESESAAAEDQASAEQAMDKLSFIYNYLKNNYYRELSDTEMIEAMYAGLVDQMDSPYTFYLDQETNAAMEDSMQGEYSGIGAQVSGYQGVYTISDIFDHSPAAEAGLHVNDQILSVDGREATDFVDVSALAVAVRGEDGSIVKLHIYRPAANQEMDLEVKRGKVDNANLVYKMLEDGIGYIRLVSFNSGLSSNFRKALVDLQKQGAETLIFDLRNNGGGYVTEVTAMLDDLLPQGVLATARGRQNGQPFEESWDAHDGQITPKDWRYTILINGNTASASELFSGALRDYRLAYLVGEKSFGKGVGSVTQQMEDGSAIQVTNFYYYLPGGDSVQDKGLAPDEEVTLPEELSGLSIGQLEADKDTQLQAALRHARELLQKTEE